jgi:hypothetical protein
MFIRTVPLAAGYGVNPVNPRSAVFVNTALGSLIAITSFELRFSSAADTMKSV